MKHAKEVLVHEAARIAGVTPAAVRAWTDSGRLASRRVSGTRLIDVRTLQRFLADREASRTDKTAADGGR